MSKHQILIAYFTRSGNTEATARVIERLIGGELFKIDPVKKYSSNYRTCTEEAQKELRANARPNLTSFPQSISGYDTIILCYPNYWGTMPMPLWTFLDKFDFAGKTIMPLCTHEGSGMGVSERDLKKLSPHSDIKAGLAIRGSSVKNSEKEIQSWLSKNNLL